MTKTLTAIMEREGDGHVSLCLELDVASQGAAVDEARSNPKEALELFFEGARLGYEQRQSKDDEQRGC